MQYGTNRDSLQHGDLLLIDDQPCLKASRLSARLGMQKHHVLNTIDKLTAEHPPLSSEFQRLINPADCLMTKSGMEMLLSRFRNRVVERAVWKKRWLLQFDSAPRSARPETVDRDPAPSTIAVPYTRVEPVDPSFPSIEERRIGGDLIQTVDARDLHRSLGVGKQFGNWIVDRIEQFSFSENRDFVIYTDFGKNPSAGRPTKEYMLTIDMAKELAMVERNEAGKRVRQYFIQCEKDLQKTRLQAPEFDIRNPLQAAKALVQALEYSKELEGKLTTVEAVSASQAAAIEIYKPIVALHEEFVRAEGSLNLRTAAKTLGLTQTEFMKRIRARYLITENGMEVPRAEFTTAGNGKGYFHVKWSMGNGKLRPQIYVTARGLTYFGIKLVRTNGRVAQMQLPHIEGFSSHA